MWSALKKVKAMYRSSSWMLERYKDPHLSKRERNDVLDMWIESDASVPQDVFEDIVQYAVSQPGTPFKSWQAFFHAKRVHDVSGELVMYCLEHFFTLVAARASFVVLSRKLDAEEMDVVLNLLYVVNVENATTYVKHFVELIVILRHNAKDHKRSICEHDKHTQEIVSHLLRVQSTTRRSFTETWQKSISTLWKELKMEMSEPYEVLYDIDPCN
jgi:hypothetical protein